MLAVDDGGVTKSRVLRMGVFVATDCQRGGHVSEDRAVPAAKLRNR